MKITGPEKWGVGNLILKPFESITEIRKFSVNAKKILWILH